MTAACAPASAAPAPATDATPPGAGSPRRWPWRAALLLAVALAGVAALRWHAFTEPLDADEANFMLFARAWQAGLPPYTAYHDNKPVGAFVLFRLGAALFGDREATPRWLALAAMLLATGLVARALRRHAWPWQVAGLVLWVPLTCLVSAHAETANLEVFLLPPLLLAYLELQAYAADGRERHLHVAAAAVVVGLLVKQVALPFLLGPAAALAWHHRRAPWRLLGRAAGWAAGAGAAHLGLYAVCGYAPTQLLTLFRDTSRYVGTFNAPLWVRAGDAAVCLVRDAPLRPLLGVTLVTLLALAWLAWRRHWRHVLPDAAFLIASAAAISLPGRAFPHYYILALPFLVLALVQGLAGVASAAALASPRRRLALVVLVVAVIWPPWLVAWREYLRWSPVQVNMRKFQTSWFAEDRDVGLGLAAQGFAHTRVFVDGSHPGVIFYSYNLPASRFYCYWWTSMGVSLADYYAQVMAKRPELCVRFNTSLLLPEADAWLTREYVPVGAIGRAQVFLRR